MKTLKLVIAVAMVAAIPTAAPAQMMPSNGVLGVHANDMRTTAIAAWQYRQAHLNDLLTSPGARNTYREHVVAISNTRSQIAEDFSTITKLMNVMHNDLENAEILQGVE